MKKALSLTLFICSCLLITQAQTLSGIVTDSATGLPVAGASVFISNTSRGTATTSEGTFNLPVLSQGRYDLIVSSIGYMTEVLHLQADSLPASLHIQLKQNIPELGTVTVEADIKSGWRQWGKLFMDNFIGTSYNAGYCRLANRKVLRFFYSKKNQRLSVRAREPLIIHNKALGYDLHYQLEGFVYDERTNIVQFTGYPLFSEMKPVSAEEQLLWLDSRRKAYLGSLHHFLQSVYAGVVDAQGFSMTQKVRVNNQEKQRVRQIYDLGQPAGTLSHDTLYYYLKILRTPDFWIQDMRVRADSLARDSTGNFKSLSFTGPLSIAYREQRADMYPIYVSKLTEYGIPVAVDKWGNYFPAGAMIAEGYWSSSEHICNMVPLDYPMPVP